MDLDRARAIAEVAKVVVASAKVEVDCMRVTGAVRGTGFIPEDRYLEEKPPERPKAVERPKLAAGAGRR